MQPFTQTVIAIIRSIPPGRVMTYGRIAALAGNPRAARQVARILHAMSAKYGLPWHRVVNGRGEIAIADEEGRFLQRRYLQEEGVAFGPDGRIDLGKYGA